MSKSTNLFCQKLCIIKALRFIVTHLKKALIPLVLKNWDKTLHKFNHHQFS
jgi:hypothetical protein